MSFEEILRKRPDLREHLLNAPPGIKATFKPKPVLAPVPVSEALKAAAKVNPESVTVRVNARGADGVVVIDPPQRAAIMEQDAAKAWDDAVIEAANEARDRKEKWAQASRDRETLYEKAKAEARTGVGEVKHIYDPIKEFEGGR